MQDVHERPRWPLRYRARRRQGPRRGGAVCEQGASALEARRGDDEHQPGAEESAGSHEGSRERIYLSSNGVQLGREERRVFQFHMLREAKRRANGCHCRHRRKTAVPDGVHELERQRLQLVDEKQRFREEYNLRIGERCSAELDFHKGVHWAQGAR